MEKVKPCSFHEFLLTFVSEYRKLNSDNICCINKIFFEPIQAFICDAPPWSYLKCMKKNACEKCQTKGRHIINSIIYNNNGAVCKKEFMRYIYKKII